MELVNILLKQHIGAPCVPTVGVGDRVKKGSLLAMPYGLGANIFSSVEGVITAIDETAVTIEPDEIQSDEYLPIDGDNYMELIKNAGIVGLGGAGFPTHVKLSTSIEGGALLVNAAECEPGLLHNIRQIELHPEKTVRGVGYAMEVCHAERAIFAIKAKNKEAVKRLKEAIKDRPDMSIFLLPDIYPMGEERAVVRETLGVLLPPDALPSKANAIVINVETAFRIAEAIEDKKPLISKNITVTGCVKNPQVLFDVPLGVSVGSLIDQCGGTEGKVGEIIMGGPFTGKSVSENDVVVKTTGGIIPTMEFPDLHGAKVGLLVCACGGSEARMREIAHKMNGEVVSVQRCKQAVELKGALKCENPGNCPGQAQKCLNMKKDGCEYIIIGNCSDCSNTVMGSAPKMGLKIFHQTDHVMRTIHHPLYRKLTVSKTVDQEV